MITLILSITTSGKEKGVDSKVQDFFKNAKRSGLWPDSESVHRSAVTKARKNLNWNIFEQIFKTTVDIAYEMWPDRKEYTWKNMSVYAIDGSKYMLPASDEIRKKFDKNSGLHNKSKRHYPICLVSTAYDVLRKIPISRTIVGNHNASEREEAIKLIKNIPDNNIIIFDRGYPSYGFIRHLDLNYKGYYLLKCSVEYTFPSVIDFVKSNKKDELIWIKPSNGYLENTSIPIKERNSSKPIQLRAIKAVSPEGSISVLLTNLPMNNSFIMTDIEELYLKRWTIEEHYRDEKTSLEIERFHSKSVNGVLQELFAVLIMTVISRALMALSASVINNSTVEPRFKYTIMSLALDAAIFACNRTNNIYSVLTDLLDAMTKVKYYRPKKPRSPQPRISKTPINKWRDAKISKLNQS